MSALFFKVLVQEKLLNGLRNDVVLSHEDLKNKYSTLAEVIDLNSCDNECAGSVDLFPESIDSKVENSSKYCSW